MGRLFNLINIGPLRALNFNTPLICVTYALDIHKNMVVECVNSRIKKFIQPIKFGFKNRTVVSRG